MTRVTTIDDCSKILDVFQKHGHNEIDSARVYGEGTCEEYLGELDYEKRGMIMDTKLYPSARGNSVMAFKKGWDTHATRCASWSHGQSGGAEGEENRHFLPPWSRSAG